MAVDALIPRLWLGQMASVYTYNVDYKGEIVRISIGSIVLESNYSFLEFTPKTMEELCVWESPPVLYKSDGKTMSAWEPAREEAALKRRAMAQVYARGLKASEREDGNEEEVGA